MIITALIAFAATYAGVSWSFSRELARAEAEEKVQFGRFLQAMLAESANNYAILNNIRRTARVGSTFAFEVRTDAIQVALGSPLSHRYADYSLINAAHLVRTQLGVMNNTLSLYRQATAGGGGITDRGVKDLKIRAETSQELIRVMQDLLDTTMPKFGAVVVADSQMKQVEERLTGIFRKERKLLDGLKK